MDSVVKSVLTLRDLSTVPVDRDTNSLGHLSAQVFSENQKSRDSLINSSADIDECGEGTDNCSKSGPAPADCVNTEGSYKCTCDKYIGYRLCTNGITCEGIIYILIFAQMVRN